MWHVLMYCWKAFKNVVPQHRIKVYVSIGFADSKYIAVAFKLTDNFRNGIIYNVYIDL